MNGHLLDGFREGVQDGCIRSKGLGKKHIQAKILDEMIAIDEERALTTMKSWATFVQMVASRDRSVPFETMAEYLPYRTMDVGEMYVVPASSCSVVSLLNTADISEVLVWRGDFWHGIDNPRARDGSISGAGAARPCRLLHHQRPLLMGKGTTRCRAERPLTHRQCNLGVDARAFDHRGGGQRAVQVHNQNRKRQIHPHRARDEE